MTSSSTSTYYDSQSGLHVSLHKDNEVSLFTKLQIVGNGINNIEDLIDKIQSLQNNEVSGSYLDFNSDSSMSSCVNHEESFAAFFASYKNSKLCILIPSSSMIVSKEIPNYSNHNIQSVFRYSDESREEISVHYETHDSANTKTTISLLDSLICDSSDPISVANGVAVLIDTTGGGDLIWVPGPNATQTLDDSLALCEELLYLDVEGQIMKARLLVDIAGCVCSDDENEEWMDECLNLGINKFMVDESQLEWSKSMVLEQNKQIIQCM